MLTLCSILCFMAVYFGWQFVPFALCTGRYIVASLIFILALFNRILIQALQMSHVNSLLLDDLIRIANYIAISVFYII